MKTGPHMSSDEISKPSREGGEAASKAENAVRHAPEGAVVPREKRTIGAETSREEDA
jgi:hypothetical protein